MTNRLLQIALLFTVIFTACKKSDSSTSVAPDTTPSAKGGSGHNYQAGVITAAEWNDLDNWTFWESLEPQKDNKSQPSYWGIYNTNRISVSITGTDGKPVISALVMLKKNGETLFTTRTDNKGKAELWSDLLQQNTNVDYSQLSIEINQGAYTINTVKPFSEGVNTITISPTPIDNRIELAFVVDATGSMGDELEYLKTEFMDVINRVKTNNPNASLATSSVFYRDQTDDYVTRVSAFSNDISTTLNFIKQQSAGGGGDFPEAVHTALNKTLSELQWSANARTRIIFLILDAPPHHDSPIISEIQQAARTAAGMGIKIIPVTASGIDKETEFLMRALSITTNGTYVFITDDSGVGNEHLSPTVGQYNVEYLNNLMVRLINKYAE
jgi:hypothetical protein